MTEAEFERCLDRWGGDLERWPDAAATAARALIARSPRAAAAHSAARRVDRYLAGLAGHTAPARLATRIAANVADQAGAATAGAMLDRLLGWLGASGWRPATLGMLLLAAGYVAGLLGGGAPDAELADDVVALAFTDLYAEIDDAQ